MMAEAVTEEVDRALGIISAAQQQADAAVADAQAHSQEIVRDGRAARRELVSVAQAEADKMLAQARDDAEHIRAEAIRESAAIAARAAAEAPAELRSEISRLREQKEALIAHVDMIRAMARTFAETVLTGLDEWQRKNSGI